MMNTSSPQNSSAKDMLAISPVFQNDPKRNSVGFRCRPFPFWTVLKKSKVANTEKVKKKKKAKPSVTISRLFIQR